MKMTTTLIMKRLQFKQNKQSGFTLLELMIVVVLVSVFAVWGIPSFGHYTTRTQVNNAIGQVTSSIKLARSQAMATGRQINLCGLAHNGSNYTGCSGFPADWSNGWGIVASITYTDAANNEITTTEVLQVYEVTGPLQITAADIVITPNGMRTGASDIVITVSPTNIGDASLDKTVTISSSSLSYKIN